MSNNGGRRGAEALAGPGVVEQEDSVDAEWEALAKTGCPDFMLARGYVDACLKANLPTSIYNLFSRIAPGGVLAAPSGARTGGPGEAPQPQGRQGQQQQANQEGVESGAAAGSGEQELAQQPRQQQQQQPAQGGALGSAAEGGGPPGCGGGLFGCSTCAAPARAAPDERAATTATGSGCGCGGGGGDACAHAKGGAHPAGGAHAAG